MNLYTSLLPLPYRINFKKKCHGLETHRLESDISYDCDVIQLIMPLWIEQYQPLNNSIYPCVFDSSEFKCSIIHYTYNL